MAATESELAPGMIVAPANQPNGSPISRSFKIMFPVCAYA